MQDHSSAKKGVSSINSQATQKGNTQSTKRTLLSKLRRTGFYCIYGGLLLLLAAPLFQLAILEPTGYSASRSTTYTTLIWIANHSFLFLTYRALLIVGFGLMIGMPFALFRIIVAQEILGRAEDEDAGSQKEERKQEEEAENAGEEAKDTREAEEQDAMPAFAWRGKGFAVLAAWSGLIGLIFSALGPLVSTLYQVGVAASINGPGNVPGLFTGLSALFAILTYTVGGGLLAFSCLFFGATIARSGRRLWPGGWVFFGYVALALAAVLSGSAVEVAFAPGSSQTLLTTPAILLFALWVLWFGVMVARLKPESESS